MSILKKKMTHIVHVNFVFQNVHSYLISRLTRKSKWSFFLRLRLSLIASRMTVILVVQLGLYIYI